MEIKRKVEFFSATNRRFVVRRQTLDQQIACPGCGHPMLTAEEVSRVFNISQRNIFQYIEGGGLHFTELAEGGTTLICIASFADVSGGQVHEGSDPQVDLLVGRGAQD